MTAEFLSWFLAQKPKNFRLVSANGFERTVEKAEYIQILDNGKILVGPNLGMGRLTVDLEDIEEIRQ